MKGNLNDIRVLAITDVHNLIEVSLSYASQVSWVLVLANDIL